MRRICVFCGSSDGTQPSHAALAIRLGEVLAQRGLGLVYGGGRTGMMGTIANAAMEAGGEVIGVIPHGLFAAEIPNEDITELHQVPDMHARKALMYSLSDGFIALPGGLGTLEEVFEAATWTTLKLHETPKRVILLDTDGFWADLIAFLDSVTDTGFIRPANRRVIARATSPEEALEMLGSGIGALDPTAPA
jgi:uncharacterized protein (TIGR00730 family)